MRNWICQLLPAGSRFFLKFFFFFFWYARSHSTEATHCLGLVVCIDKWRLQINVKRHVNHHPLTLQLHPEAAGHQSRFMLFFLLSLSLASNSTARLPAGAAWLVGGEVATRGQPHVSISHTQTRREEGERRLFADLLCHPFFFFYLPFLYVTRAAYSSLCWGSSSSLTKCVDCRRFD